MTLIENLRISKIFVWLRSLGVRRLCISLILAVVLMLSLLPLNIVPEYDRDSFAVRLKKFIVAKEFPDERDVRTDNMAISSVGRFKNISNVLPADLSDAGPFKNYFSRRNTGDCPILLLANSSNPYNEYYAEVLLCEGLNGFTIRPLADISKEILTKFKIVILAEAALTQSEVALLEEWVNEGGRLIVMRPDKKLVHLLGLTDSNGTVLGGRMLLHHDLAAGAGIVAREIQFHGNMDCYKLNGAVRLASYCSGADSPSEIPAVTFRSVGNKGGKVAAFTFDVARSIAYTRQGNPDWANQSRSGRQPLRPHDLFYGGSATDPKPDWVDLNSLGVPQADELQRFLANLLITMVIDRISLPRFWYFPSGYKALVVMTGDDHDSGGTAGRFDKYAGAGKTSKITGEWGKVRATSYMFTNGPMTNRQVSEYNKQGFEIGLHLNSGCVNYTREKIDRMLCDQLKAFNRRYPDLPMPTTLRMHCVAWSGYTVLPEVEEQYGIRLDTSYYMYPPDWIKGRVGFMTGSGMPMRFATSGGRVIDVYQAATQMTDESSQDYPRTVDTLLDGAIGKEEYYGAFVANMHTDSVSSPESDFIISSAVKRGVPVISAKQLLAWLDGRNSSTVFNVRSLGDILTFSQSVDSAAVGLRTMVPIPNGRKVVEVRSNNIAELFVVMPVKGISYAVFDGASGDFQVTFAGVDSPASNE